MCDGKLELLIIHGKCEREELESAWADIVAEYSEAMGGGEHKMSLLLYKQVGQLAADLKMIYFLVEVMKDVYAPRLAEELNALVEANFLFDPNQPEEYNKMLQGCIDRSTSKKIDLKMKEDQLAEIQKNNKPGKAPTKRSFDSILITLSDHAKFQISDDITVFQYCERIKRFNQYLESLKKR